jgi:NifB/MoaA-like Fe-S oxidoreductase
MEEITINLNWKLPFGTDNDGRYDRLETGGSWTVSGEELEQEDLRELKKQAMKDFLQDLRDALEEEANIIIQEIAREKIEKIKKEYEKKLDAAREAIIQAREDK